jgi:methyl-accepting chemotaxis protein
VVYQRTRNGMLALLGVTLLSGLGLTVWFTRRLLRQLGGQPNDAVAMARAVADGDLSTQLRLRAGDTQSLMANLQSMQQSLARAVTQVREGSESVATASSQIADGNQDLSGRTEQQASALQETASPMEELGTRRCGEPEAAGPRIGASGRCVPRGLNNSFGRARVGAGRP